MSARTGDLSMSAPRLIGVVPSLFPELAPDLEVRAPEERHEPMRLLDPFDAPIAGALNLDLVATYERAIAGVDPCAVPCPLCRVGAGSPCKSPSGHRSMRVHADRVALARHHQENTPNV